MGDGGCDIYSGFTGGVRRDLGLFWSMLYDDREFLDAVLTGHGVAAVQADIDVAEARAARNHAETQAHHRVHWAPVLVRRSRRDSVAGLRIGMPGDPVIGTQHDPQLYDDASVFVVGRNLEHARTVLYPIEGHAPVRVCTCLCDSISRPTAMLSPGSDFDIMDGVLRLRGEYDPFTCGNFRRIDDGRDEVAVMWACDALYDTGAVYRFLGCPLGLDMPTSERARDLTSCLWDIVVFGLTQFHLNRFLGVLYAVPVTLADETVESVADGVVVTDRAVYHVDPARVLPGVVPGATLPRGSFLTDNVAVHGHLSKTSAVDVLADIGSVALPAGSIGGVDTARVVVGDDIAKYAPAMHNMCVVTSDIDIPDDSASRLAYGMLMRLVPVYGGLQFIQYVSGSGVSSGTGSGTVSVAHDYVAAVLPPTGPHRVACTSACDVLMVPARQV